MLEGPGPTTSSPPASRCFIMKPRFIQTTALAEIMGFPDQPQSLLTFIKHNVGTGIHNSSLVCTRWWLEHPRSSDVSSSYLLLPFLFISAPLGKR